ncbi:MAG: alcohol dehydrogenase catalytic domain-containing protein, partial [Planctomycetota bacterium]
MRSVSYHGDRTLKVEDAHRSGPGSGEVRLDVAYCGVCGTDMHIFHGAMDARVAKPQILGHEVSATVAELGEGVDSVRVGYPVAVRPLSFGEPTVYDRDAPYVGKNLKFIGIDLPGGMQSSWTVPAYTLHRLPDGVPMTHGAMIEPAAVACHDVRLGEVASGETCVVIGGG